VQTEDILKSTLSNRKKKRPQSFGFFAPRHPDGWKTVRDKIEAKVWTWLVLNDAHGTRGGALGVGLTTRVTVHLVATANRTICNLRSKVNLAEVRLDRIEENLGGRRLYCAYLEGSVRERGESDSSF